MIRLVISDNEGTTTVVPLARDEVSIGRKEGNTIRLTERNVSRKHCQIERQNGAFLLRDLGSYNGVLVNGQRISGESAVKEGDEIRVGDYTLHLEAEKPAQVEVPTAPPPEKARAAQRARLVVLTEPVAGAEFVLPETGELRIGRAAELDVAIDHRSVSREHAKITCANGEVRIADLGSVNGLVINRQKVDDAALKPGDVVELGDVFVRFVGPDEHYVFDPADARSLRAPRAMFVQKSHVVAAGIVGAALVLAVAIVSGGRKPAPPPAAVASAPSAGTTKPAAAPAADNSRFPELLDACRQAISGGRFAEAMAHATAALKEKPGAPDALDCQRLARADHEQEQIYVRGRAAAQGGDMEGAWNELSTLSATSVVSQRPEVAQEVAAVASARLQEARRALPAEPDRASLLARSLIAAPAVPPQITAQAESLLVDADKQANTKTARAEAVTRRAAAAEPRARAKAVSAAAPAELPAELRAPAVEKISPMEAASACLARGDNLCVVRALNGRTQTAQELGLLIETFRALGDSTQAYRNMMTYVQRFPTARRAEAYRQMLDRQGL
jgi:pSer/pThr/pTyr-binding forkhead associated (FHA) protein